MSAPLVSQKSGPLIDIAELSSSPVIEYSETIETHPIPTFLLPPSPIHIVAPCPQSYSHPILNPAFLSQHEADAAEVCISRFSVTTLDTASVGLSASRTSIVTTHSAGGGCLHVPSSSAAAAAAAAAMEQAEYSLLLPPAQLRSSIATIATANMTTSSATSTQPSPSSPRSQLQLAAQATLIRTPERAARLVSLRRVCSEGVVCRAAHAAGETMLPLPLLQRGAIGGSRNQGDSPLEDEAEDTRYASSETSEACSPRSDDGAAPGKTAASSCGSEADDEADDDDDDDDEAHAAPAPVTVRAREGWGRPSRWISRSTSVPEARRYHFLAPAAAPTPTPTLPVAARAPTW